MANDLQFRILKTQNDLRQAQDLLNLQVNSEHHSQAHLNWDSQMLEQMFQKPGIIFWGGFNVEKLIVFICIQNLISDQFEIHLLLTDERFRRTGAATLAIESFVRKQCKKGDDLWLEVHEGNNSALKFYEKLGFKIDGFRKNYYIDGGRAINLSLKIDSAV